MTYTATYEIYQHRFTREFEATDKDRAWRVFWSTVRHDGSQCLPEDKGVLLSLLRNRAHVVLVGIEEKPPAN